MAIGPRYLEECLTKLQLAQLWDIARHLSNDLGSGTLTHHTGFAKITIEIKSTQKDFDYGNEPAYKSGNKKLFFTPRRVATLRAFFLGGFGAQWLYLGKTSNFIRSLLFFWTSIPAWIAVYHVIKFLLISDEDFAAKYL